MSLTSRHTTHLRRLGLVGAVLLCFYLTFPQEVEAADCCPPGFVAGELIVGFEPGTTQDRVLEIASGLGAFVIELIMDLPTGPAYLMGVPEGKELIFIPLFEAFPEVSYAQPNGFMCIPEWPLCQCCPPGLICPTVPPCPIPGVPGDCNGDGLTTIDEVQKIINCFLGILMQECCCDLNGDGKCTIDEVQKVINAFLGI